MQSVNLYLPELRPSREWLTASSLIILSIGFVFLLSIGAVMGHVKLNKFESSIVELEKRQLETQQRLSVLKTKAGAGNIDKLDREIKRLRQLLSNRARINDVILDQSLGNQEGYSSPLESIAMFSNDHIALQRFRLSQGDSIIEMAGETNKPAELARFVDNLSQQPSLSGSRFGSLTVVEKRSHSNRFDFSLGFEALFDKNTQMADTDK